MRAASCATLEQSARWRERPEDPDLCLGGGALPEMRMKVLQAPEQKAWTVGTRGLVQRTARGCARRGQATA
jgi:hypothetical protein